MIRWAIISGEYPPQPGGVADYTQLVAEGLAATGDEVTVYAPPVTHEPIHAPGVVRLPDRFGPRSLVALDSALAKHPRPDRLLIQYVPHGFGWKAMNLPFAAWIASRACRLAPLWVMFHEVAFPFSWRLIKNAILGSAHQAMARLVAGAAERLFVSIPAWAGILRGICPGVGVAEWLPVPCTLKTNSSIEAAIVARTRFAPFGAQLVGHFGTFGRPIANILEQSIVIINNQSGDVRTVLLGRNSQPFARQITTTHPELNGRVEATGELSGGEVSAHLRACDVLIQPFPDGVSSRRTSVMAGLANGLPVVTNLGCLSESLWTCGAVAATATPDPVAIGDQVIRLLADTAARTEMSQQALALYRDTFALEHTIAKLRAVR